MGDEKQFTKNDMERMGIFKEMQYITIKDPYKNKGKSGKYIQYTKKINNNLYLF